MAHIAQIGSALSAPCLGVDGAQAEVPAVCTAVFLRYGVQRPAALVLDFVGIRRKAAVALKMQIVKAALRPAAVVEVQQVAERPDLHLVDGVFCCQGENAFFFVIGNAHG